MDNNNKRDGQRNNNNYNKRRRHKKNQGNNHGTRFHHQSAAGSGLEFNQSQTHSRFGHQSAAGSGLEFNQPQTHSRPQTRPQRHFNDNKQHLQQKDDKNNRERFNDSCINFTFIKTLSNKNSDEVLTTVTREDKKFEKFFCNANMQPDVIVLTLKILVKVCQANFTELMASVLNQACSTNFLKILENYLQKLPFDDSQDEYKNSFYYNDKSRFWTDLIEFFQKVIELIPKTACNKLTPVVKKIDTIIPIIEQQKKYQIDDQVKDGIKNIIKDLEEEMKQMEEKRNSVNVNDKNEKEENPPESFRELSVIPTVQDLFDENPFLRTCKIKDGYDSVDHYLDVQFRLLKQDFIKPLRNGIKEYLETTQKNRNSDFRIYKTAKLINFEIDKNTVGIKLFFGKLKSVDWNRSKRLIFGSLLLLSRDNFETVLFATVTNRDLKDLNEGYIMIEPCKGTIITPDMYTSSFVLLESKIYFEPYFEVLTAMQNIYAIDFPMERYLIRAKTSTYLPQYLENVPVLSYKKKFVLPIGGNNVWPTPQELKLDESQYKAFISALTEEFAIIQGPPGTGKTFLALEIVSTLLENKENWINYGPIVVVCLTNHALDQFLEGILQYTTSIVRVGSRSKSEALKSFSLMERRKLCRKKNNVNSLLFKKKCDLEGVLALMQKLRSLIKYLKTPNIIVPLSCFEYCPDFPKDNFKSSEELLFWILGENINKLLDECLPYEEVANLQQEAISNPVSVQETNPQEMADALFIEDENIDTDDKLLLDWKKIVVDDSHGPFCPTKIYDGKIKLIRQYINNLKIDGINTEELNLQFDELAKWEDNLKIAVKKQQSIHNELMQHPLINPSSRGTKNERWNVYWNWIINTYHFLSQEMFKQEEIFRKLNAELNEIKQIADLEVMKDHEIIGLTTSRAAKMQSSLRALRAPIVLVEEAAEILEAHVVCSMTKHCQHVILIGDHKQLRPKASVYEYGIKYKLNVSLFERMVNIRGDCAQLAYQHRMRPEIAKLITPSIYKTLYNHQSVMNYPHVRGVENSIFFLNHSHSEENYNNEESYKNKHEVEFFTTFAKHLLMQGYLPSEITVLCTYTGQMFAFMTETMRNSLLKGVRVTTVDNYQGEENKIILLSLVRNNGKGNIGFLKEENRVCVALSRAREGLFIMGNMDDLVAKANIWTEIKNVLEDGKALGSSLKLRCQIHSDQISEVTAAADFKKCPEGGCSRKCDLLLPCGHTCTSICHVLDRNHEKYRCKQQCTHKCPNEHPCPLRCYEGCKPCVVKVKRLLKCGHIGNLPCSLDPNQYHCTEQVKIILPDCKHELIKPCYLPTDKCICTHDCEIRLSCGHSCQGKCHVRSDPDHLQYKCVKDCTRINIGCTLNHVCKKRCYEECNSCSILVPKVRSCGHHYLNVVCSFNIENEFCKRRCDRILNCGHKCRLQCSEECGNCKEKVIKKSTCGHNIHVKCSEEATPAKCNNKCIKILSCGHNCTMKCKEPCTVNCNVMVPLKYQGVCGHKFSVPCHLRSSDPKSRALLKYCDAPCGAELECTHPCAGTCGSCLQGRVHAPCTEPCRSIFICGHSCTTPCNQDCQPCVKDCNLQCIHSKCNKKCGEPCKPCQEPCNLKCKHKSCKKKCHENCDIEPCMEPCENILKCNHPCIGFCGDPCPPLCRICNYDELIDFDMGTKEDPNARFIFLKECGKNGHCIESEAFLTWITSETNNTNGSSDEAKEIKMPVCPQCKTPIKSCQRIMNLIKNNLKDLVEIKKKTFTNNRRDLEGSRTKYLEEIKNMENESILLEFTELKYFIQNLNTLIKPVRNNRHQTLNYHQINALKNFIELLKETIFALKLIKKSKFSFDFIKNQINVLVEILPNTLQISKQRLTDVQLEMRRLHLMIKVYNLFYDTCYSSETLKEFSSLTDTLSCIQRFTEDVEKHLINLSKKITNKKLTEIERQMIVKAMNLGKGHWFKCPNGHFFAIGECGGAMERGKCIECKADVGGGQHQLLTNNAFAPEVDGAREPAYPTLVHQRPGDFQFD